MLQVKIKKWSQITKEEKINQEVMIQMKELYEKSTADWQIDINYKKICDQITTNRLKIEKEQAALLIKEEKEKEKLNKVKLAAMVKEQSNLEKEVAKLQVKAAKVEKIKLDINSSMMEIDEIIDTYNIWQTGSGNLSWFLQETYENEYGDREWTCLKKDTLIARFPQLAVRIRGSEGVADYQSFIEFTEIIVKKNRIFTKLIQSWTKKTGNGTLNLLRKNFCAPQDEITYHWIIDAVFESVSGGNTSHLEDIIYSKYLYPENIFLPHPFINDQGSSGKGVWVARFLTRLYGGAVADNCNIEHLTGKFNGVIAGKAIVFINETAREKVDVEKVKAFLGSPSFMVEEKFEKPYLCENTALVISATNQESGGITLSGANSDRRYSIFSAKSDIYQVIMKYFKNKEGKDITKDEARDWLEEVGQYILNDEIEVGKWVACMIATKGDVKNVRADHGDEYKTLVNRQRGAWTQTVEQVFNEPGFTYIRESLLRELIQYCNRGEVIPGKKRMNEEIIRVCKDKGIPVVMMERVSINNVKKSIQRTVWKKDNKKNTVNEDESMYGTTDIHGRWVWKWIP